MDLTWLLDTNICIYIAKHRPPEVARRFAELEVGQVGMSVVTYGELHNGAMKSQQREIALDKLEGLTGLIPVLPMAESVGQQYGKIRSHLEQSGTPIGNNDGSICVSGSWSLQVLARQVYPIDNEGLTIIVFGGLFAKTLKPIMSLLSYSTNKKRT